MVKFMLVVLLVLMEWSDFAPVDRTVCMVESVWSVGLLIWLTFKRKRTCVGRRGDLSAP